MGCWVSQLILQLRTQAPGPPGAPSSSRWEKVSGSLGGSGFGENEVCIWLGASFLWEFVQEAGQGDAEIL